jgi:hypothetical protein
LALNSKLLLGKIPIDETTVAAMVTGILALLGALTTACITKCNEQ